MSICYFWDIILAIRFDIDFSFTFMKLVLPMTLKPFLVLVSFVVVTVAKDENLTNLVFVLETGVIPSLVKSEVLIVVGCAGITCLSVDKSNGSKGHVLKRY